MTIDCWITEVAEEINDEEVNPDSKLYSKVFSKMMSGFVRRYWLCDKNDFREENRLGLSSCHGMEIPIKYAFQTNSGIPCLLAPFGP